MHLLIVTVVNFGRGCIVYVSVIMRVLRFWFRSAAIKICARFEWQIFSNNLEKEEIIHIGPKETANKGRSVVGDEGEG